MWMTIFNRISHPCVMTDVLSEVKIGVGVDMLSGMEIIVMDTSTITLGFVVGLVPAVDFFADLLTVDVDMFPDDNVHGLTAVMTPLESEP